MELHFVEIQFVSRAFPFRMLARNDWQLGYIGQQPKVIKNAIKKKKSKLSMVN